MYRERSEQSEPTRDESELVTAAHLKATMRQVVIGLEKKNDAMWVVAAAAAVLAVLSAIVCGPTLFLSTAWWVKVLCAATLAASASGVAYALHGFSKRRALHQELGARLVDVEQCSDAKREHYVRRALATVKKANDHLGVES